MKASKYIAKQIKKEVPTVFGITGGAVVNLVNSLEKEINFVNLHHEQACAMAADAYSRIYGFGVCLGTSGPGAQNLLTGLSCSWFDSYPVLALAGQVPSSQLKKDSGVRQKGFQETDNASIFEPITKYSDIVEEAENLSEKLDLAIEQAKKPRKGPTFLEICDDVQRAKKRFKKQKTKKIVECVSEEGIEEIKAKLYVAKKPIVIIGRGCQDYRKETKKMLKKLSIPYFLTWGAMDLADDDNLYNLRDFGVTPSNYVSNYVLEQADLILVLGSRLDTHQPLDTNAEIIKIDIDFSEVDEKSIIYFGRVLEIVEMLEKLNVSKGDWLSKIVKTKRKHEKEKTHANEVIKDISEETPKNTTIITDAGQTLTWTMQSWKVKEGQRLFSAFNHSPMGYAVPASIGAYYAHKDKGEDQNIVCITGDGGLMMNLQELASIGGRNLPIKIFVFDNGGYGMIRQTQSDWKALKERVATQPPMMNLEELAETMGLHYYECGVSNKKVKIFNFSSKEPALIRLKVPKDNRIKPKLKYGDKLTDLTPKLSKKEIKEIKGDLENER